MPIRFAAPRVGPRRTVSVLETASGQRVPLSALACSLLVTAPARLADIEA